MRTYEVFLKKPGKAPFEHAGSLEAPDPEMAMILARETYARRAEGEHMWIVDRSAVVDVPPEFIQPNQDKPHRHNDGALLAERRRSGRDGATE
ncbi:MAG TPA: 1,2-phenylacetyl-CoA epoxidase subunit B [Acidimicrobiia bacterium]|jgi:ring-1,2-phenylacetyl-CoA epoxidase subunit PaaB